MKPYPCGCTADGTTRCAEHERWLCHRIADDPYDPSLKEWIRSRGECPPCKLARLRSVNLDSSATPTRGGGK